MEVIVRPAASPSGSRMRCGGTLSKDRPPVRPERVEGPEPRQPLPFVLSVSKDWSPDHHSRSS